MSRYVNSLFIYTMHMMLNCSDDKEEGEDKSVTEKSVRGENETEEWSEE